MKSVTFTVILALALTLCSTLVWMLPAGAQELRKTPIWQIFKDSKAAISVKWQDADNPRFAVYDAGTPAVQSDDVVLDKETGLVWKKIPGTTLRNWFQATYDCIGETAGRRWGWRLPTVEELLSLRGGEGPALAEGHPFSIINDPGTQPSYWSSTTDIMNSNAAYPVCFPESGGCLYEAIKNNASNYVWCVRGGQGYDAH